MTVIFQKLIKREDLRRNPQVLYVFGDNVMRRELGGQAREMRGEANGVGVATKASPYEFFGNESAQVVVQNRIIDEDMKILFAHTQVGRVVVWPADGIGTGLSRLPEMAPLTFEYLEAKLAALLKVARLFESGYIDAARDLTEKHL